MKLLSTLLILQLTLTGCTNAHLDIFPPLPDPALTQTQLAPAALREDVDALIAGVSQRHPDFAGYAAQAELAALANHIKAELTRPLSRLEFYRKVGQLSHLFHDGHSFLLWPYPEYEALKAQGERPFPLQVRLKPDGLYIAAGYRHDGQIISAGSKVLSINGRPVAELFAKAQQYVGGETRLLREAMVAEWFPVMLWAVFGFISDFDLQLERDGQSQQVLISRQQQWQPQQAAQESPTAGLRLSWPASDVAYLYVDSFDVDPAEFTEALAQQFRQISAKTPHSLIIDIRHNTGGNTDTAAELARYLADRPFRLVSQVTEKLNADNRGWFGYKGEAGELRVADWDDWLEPVPQSERYQGEVYVLIGPATYSAAIVFATALQDQGFGRLAGQATGGFANQTAQGNLFNLPHSQLRAYVATRLLRRPSAAAQTAPVQPDLPLSAEHQSGLDSQLSDMLQQLQQGRGPAKVPGRQQQANQEAEQSR